MIHNFQWYINNEPSDKKKKKIKDDDGRQPLIIYVWMSLSAECNWQGAEVCQQIFRNIPQIFYAAILDQ